MGIGFVLGWAFFGLIVGAIARMIWPGSQRLGCLGTMLLGIAGSVVGGLIVHALTGGPDSDYYPASWLMSIVGAIVVLWIAGALSRRNPQ